MTVIYFINRFFHPDISSTSQILSDLCQGLAADQSLPSIQVITSRNVYEGEKKRLLKKEIWQEVIIHRLWTTQFGRKTTIGRLADYLSFYLSTFLFLLFHLKKNNVVIIKTDPPLLSIPISWIASWKRVKMVQWLQDIFPEVAEKLDIKAPKFVFSILKKLRNQAWKKSDHLVVISQGMKNQVIEEVDTLNHKITIIPNWADDKLRPIAKAENAFIKQWQLEKKFVVGYSGNFGSAHYYQELAEAGAYFSQDLDITFVIIGGGTYYRKLQQQKNLANWGNWLFLPYQDKSNLSETLSVADVHIVSLNSKVDGYIFPSKIYGIMAVARPIIFIGDALGDCSQFIEKNQCGVIVKEGDTASLIKHILFLKNNSADAERMGENGRLAYFKTSGLQLSLELWKNLIKSLK